ncbi:hypothetical protein [Bacteroides thetaiotaomicron]|uniref:hypothetical protein n=1 Tax=Bacteroides thetaiotaomicron TaxID=818 RepID=UPI0021663798|nr:hypothetical protein [Bacteroides thetaiotaomicron]MCS2207900.1 hypothetical protein [Bacteroides thetaiotaomicron]
MFIATCHGNKNIWKKEAHVPRSDEAMFSWYQWVNYLSFNNGSWGPSTPNYNIWKAKYAGIGTS